MHYIILLVTFTFLGFFGFGQSGLVERLEKHVAYLASEELEGRGLGTEGTKLAKTYIIQEFESAGLKKFGGSYKHEFDMRISLAWLKGTNIMGYLEGSDEKLKDEYILIGGHYDHLGYSLNGESKTIFPGADDNASGTAGVIELAKHFSKAENRTKRSIIFVCFDAEESGLIGSTYIAENPPVPIEQIKLMFSLDMIGMLEGYGGLDLKGLGLFSDGKKLFKPEAEKLGIKLKNTSGSIEQQTDTAPYGKEGIPAIHAFTGLKSPYHKPEDQSHLLDYEGMAMVVTLLQNGVKRLDELEEISLAKGVDKEKIMNGGKRPFLYGSVILHNGLGNYRFIDDYFVSKRRYNAALGLQLQFRINANFRVLSELLVDYNGSASLGGNVRRVSTTIPLMLQIATSDATSEDFRGFLNVGGFYRNNLLASQGGDELLFENGFQNEEFGFSGSIGFQARQFQFFYTYRRTFSDNSISGSRFQDVNNLIGFSYRLW
jgi:hypothetical protein